MANKIKAYELASRQKEISISEFFTKNRHLLGFDKPTRALLMAVKESVDNALDACDETEDLPQVIVQIKKLSEDKFKLIVEDNGPGILKSQIPKIFGKLLYGSKFHTLKQNRGQQGIGISAVVLYSQLTTGKSTKIISRVSKNKPAHYYEIQIDTQKNEPKIMREETVEWNKDTGTRLEIELEGKYLKGKQSVDEYIKQTAISNPHAEIIYTNPFNEKMKYMRGVQENPRRPKEIKPHPYGVELGTLIWMLQATSAKTLQGFLTNDFSRVGYGTAKEICNKAGLSVNKKPKEVNHTDAEKLIKSIKETKIMAPPTDCLSPIGAETLEKSMKKEFNADYFTSISRSPNVYRGFPFIVEAGLAYGGDLPKDDSVKLIRFANRVPLLFQQKACAIYDAVSTTNWKPYGLNQSGNNLPVGPAVIIVHLASVWPPFTSEAKDALAHYDEIIKEIKLALQNCGRKLGAYVRKNIKAKEQKERVNMFENYIPELTNAISNLTNVKKDVLNNKLKIILNKNIKIILDENGKEKK